MAVLLLTARVSKYVKIKCGNLVPRVFPLKVPGDVVDYRGCIFQIQAKCHAHLQSVKRSSTLPSSRDL